jgi:type I restriction enzyme S subunit
VRLPDEFARFPKEWRVLPFLEAISDATAGNPKIKVEDYLEGGLLPIVDQGQELFNGYTNDSQLACDTDLPAIVFGDHTRRFKFIEEPFALGADGAKLLKPKVKFDPKFLYYYLCQLKIESAGYSRHYKFLKETFVPVPPLETQKHIAWVLEQADKLRKQAQQMESELNQLAQSLFSEMFGDYHKQTNDCFVPLSRVADVVSGVAKGSDLKGKQSRIVPYLRVANVQDGFLDLSEIKEIEATERDIEKYVLQPGDILMTEGGDYDKLGRGAMWSGEVEECIHQNHIFRVRLSEAYEPKFFEYYLRSTMAKIYFLRCAKKTTNLASINMSQLKALPTPNEDRKKQERFVSALSAIEKQIQMAKTKGKHLEEAFQALIQRAFKGELTAPGSKAA